MKNQKLKVKSKNEKLERENSLLAEMLRLALSVLFKRKVTKQEIFETVRSNN